MRCEAPPQRLPNLARVSQFLDYFAEDIAQAVRYFAGPESSWTTGQFLTVDGGASLRAFIDYRDFMKLPDQRAAALADVPTKESKA